MVFISSQTASSSASLSFTSGIDSTYDEYVFYFVNINPVTDNADFTFQANAVGESGYNETMTTTFFNAHHYEADNSSGLAYVASWDQAQGTAFQVVAGGVGNGADESASGELFLFAPSSTTYVKQFYATCNRYGSGDLSVNEFMAGYLNTTTAIDDIQFKMSSGNFDGIIKLYGISKS